MVAADDLSMKTKQTQGWFSPNEILPAKDERVIVVCEEYRCLGYVDPEGVWRQDKDGAPINGVVGWGKLAREGDSVPRSRFRL